jgi:hypothetical protein
MKPALPIIAVLEAAQTLRLRRDLRPVITRRMLEVVRGPSGRDRREPQPVRTEPGAIPQRAESEV